MKLFSSLLLVLAISSAAAQKKVDTVKYSFVPSGIRFGTDVLSLIKSGVDEKFHGWEVNADADVYKYYLAVDYGSWGKKEFSADRQYENSGTYWRAGLDINLIKKDPDHNMFYFGARYAHSGFSETLTTSITDPVYGTKDLVTFNNPNASAHWLEFVTGLKVKIWKELWVGYTCRLKFGLGYSNAPQMIPADVPGYGYNDGMTWGFNYQVFWRIPLKKEKSALPEK